MLTVLQLGKCSDQDVAELTMECINTALDVSQQINTMYWRGLRYFGSPVTTPLQTQLSCAYVPYLHAALFRRCFEAAY